MTDQLKTKIDYNHILIVDDEYIITDVLTQQLTEAGYSITTAFSGNEALQKAAAETPDLILLDLHLPDISGLEVCRRLKSQLQFQDTAVIFMSGYSDHEGIEAAFAAGGADFISKQFLHDTVEARIANQLRLLQAHNGLFKLLTRFENVFMTAGDAMFILKQENGQLVEANLAACKMYGFTRDEFLQLKATDLSAEPEKSARARREGKQFAALRYHKKKDGTIFPVEIAANYYVEGGENLSVVNIRDITEQENSRNLLQKSLNESIQFRTALDMVNSFIYMKDLESRYLYVNKAMLDLYGCSEEEVMRKGDAAYFPPSVVKRFRELDMRTFQGQHVREEVVLNQPGRYQVFLDTKVPLYSTEDGTINGLLGISVDITTQKKALDHYKTIFENFPALVWMSGNDTLCYYFNKTWLNFTGRSLEEEMGNGWAEGVYPEDFDRCLKIHLENFEQRKPFDMEYRLKHFSGQYRWISDHGQPYYDTDGVFCGYIGSCYDITEKKEQEIEHLRLSTAIEQIGATIVITDRKGKIEYANPYTTRLTGFTIDEALGKNPRIFKSGKHERSFYEHLWQTITSGNIWKGRFTNRKKDGSFYEEDAIIAPVKNQNGEIINFVAIKQDVTEILSLEDKLRRSQKMQAIGVLAAGIAHEINSPMQYILDNTRFMEDNVNDFLKLLNILKEHNYKCEPENCANIKNLVQALDLEFLNKEIPQAISENIIGITKVRNIVSALKDFSFPRGFVSLETDINKMLETILLITASTWKLHARIEKNFATNLPMIPCYADEMNQVFINLIVNAVDAIKEKGTEEGLLVITTSQTKDCVQISITDTGAGIPTQIRDKIFEPFFTTKEVGKGTGQGLAIVYDIIYNLHKGSIEVNSEVGKGTEFIIKLPLHGTE